MKIIQYKKTNIAEAPDELSKAINKYSDHTSEVVRRITSNIDADVIHFHNKIPRIDHDKTLVQYHSEPFRVDLRSHVDKRLVIAQYHATLPEYANCELVRNIVDFETDAYEQRKVTDKIRVGFSPSIKTRVNKWYDKGYWPTRRVLERLTKEYPERFDFDIITGVPLEQCIERKKNCNIIIDECVTPSYHRSGLEGLALGKLTICSVSNEIQEILAKVSGSPKNPFFDFKMENLYHGLKNIIENEGVDYVLTEGQLARRWVEENWHPQDIVNEFIELYKLI